MARAIAIIGMLVAHIGTGHGPLGRDWGWQWMWIFDGRSSATFATLAGISIALICRHASRTQDRLDWRAARVKIAVRAAIIMPIGIVLQMLGTPVAIILPTYAVLFFMALPVVRWPTPALLGAAAIALAIGPVIVLGVRQATTGGIEPTWYQFGFGVGELIWGAYPALVWIAYLLVGICVGRGNLSSPGYAGMLMGIGTVLAALGYGGGLALQNTLNLNTNIWPDALGSIEPHADTLPEVTGNIGVALAVVGICLLITAWRPIAIALWPMAAMGSMALTVYVIQIVVIAALGPDSVWYPTSNVPLVALTLGCLLFASIWRATLGQGPLERGLKLASDAAARSVLATGLR